MLDIRFIRENTKAVEESLIKRGAKFNLSKVLELDKKRIEAAQKRDELRSQQKTASTGDNKDIATLKKLKTEVQKADAEAQKYSVELNSLMLALPNIVDADVPAGGEENNKEVRKWGESVIAKQSFKYRDHVELGEKLGILDFERGVKIAGSKFYFVKGEGALLSRAITSYVLDLLTHKGYEFMLSPHLATSEIIWGKGLLSQEEIDLNIYKIEDEDKYLIGTGEIPLTGFHAKETLELGSLPLKYSTLTPCYRKESGTYGKHAKGIFRVHQFEKLEMYQLVEPSKSAEALQELLSIEEEILQSLGIPYRVMLVAAGDIPGVLSTMYDIEYWSPVDSEYREITSAGNARDFQARRLGIRYRGEDGKLEHVHTLNATASNTSRFLIAIMENYQTEDGSIEVPKVLHQYMDGKTIIGGKK